LVLEAIREVGPKAVILDSIQTVYLAEASGSAGSVSQVRECATAMLRAAKQTGIPIFLVGHVTKSGDIAGPKILEHVVDVVLYMEVCPISLPLFLFCCPFPSISCTSLLPSLKNYL
jgi:DNA repair protein RadA/Sms